MLARCTLVFAVLPLLTTALPAHAACTPGVSIFDHLSCMTDLTNANEADLAAQRADDGVRSLDIAANAAEIGVNLDLICDLAESIKGLVPVDSPLVSACGLSYTAFATSTLHDGDLGGAAGADAICQDLADTAGLAGTYRAWISDSTRTPAGSMRGNIPYLRVDGVQIAASTEDLLEGRIDDLISLDETGAPVAASGGSSDAWTGTNSDGTLRRTCGDWTTADPSTKGHAGQTNQRIDDWTSSRDQACDQLHHLFCFEQP